ncbi:hypothetical protein QOT17_023489 [Balamuthia mandrillaris]
MEASSGSGSGGADVRKLFAGMVVAFAQRLSRREWGEWERTVCGHGGVLGFSITPETTHVVAQPEDFASLRDRVPVGARLVTTTYLRESLAQGALLDSPSSSPSSASPLSSYNASTKDGCSTNTLSQLKALLPSIPDDSLPPPSKKKGTEQAQQHSTTPMSLKKSREEEEEEKREAHPMPLPSFIFTAPSTLQKEKTAKGEVEEEFQEADILFGVEQSMMGIIRCSDEDFISSMEPKLDLSELRNPDRGYQGSLEMPETSPRKLIRRTHSKTLTVLSSKKPNATLGLLVPNSPSLQRKNKSKQKNNGELDKDCSPSLASLVATPGLSRSLDELTVEPSLSSSSSLDDDDSLSSIMQNNSHKDSPLSFIGALMKRIVLANNNVMARHVGESVRVWELDKDGYALGMPFFPDIHAIERFDVFTKEDETSLHFFVIELHSVSGRGRESLRIYNHCGRWNSKTCSVKDSSKQYRFPPDRKSAENIYNKLLAWLHSSESPLQWIYHPPNSLAGWSWLSRETYNQWKRGLDLVIELERLSSSSWSSRSSIAQTTEESKEQTIDSLSALHDALKETVMKAIAALKDFHVGSPFSRQLQSKRTVSLILDNLFFIHSSSSTSSSTSLTSFTAVDEGLWHEWLSLCFAILRTSTSLQAQQTIFFLPRRAPIVEAFTNTTFYQSHLLLPFSSSLLSVSQHQQRTKESAGIGRIRANIFIRELVKANHEDLDAFLLKGLKCYQFNLSDPLASTSSPSSSLSTNLSQWQQHQQSSQIDKQEESEKTEEENHNENAITVTTKRRGQTETLEGEREKTDATEACLLYHCVDSLFKFPGNSILHAIISETICALFARHIDEALTFESEEEENNEKDNNALDQQHSMKKNSINTFGGALPHEERRSSRLTLVCQKFVLNNCSLLQRILSLFNTAEDQHQPKSERRKDDMAHAVQIANAFESLAHSLALQADSSSISSPTSFSGCPPSSSKQDATERLEENYTRVLAQVFELPKDVREEWPRFVKHKLTSLNALNQRTEAFTPPSPSPHPSHES